VAGEQRQSCLPSLLWDVISLSSSHTGEFMQYMCAQMNDEIRGLGSQVLAHQVKTSNHNNNKQKPDPCNIAFVWLYGFIVARSVAAATATTTNSNKLEYMVMKKG
jgi:hypothetical protein